MSMMNKTSERLKARHSFICQHFKFYEQLKFCAQLSKKKSFITSGPDQTALNSDQNAVCHSNISFDTPQQVQ